jgi:hypothetical protein
MTRERIVSSLTSPPGIPDHMRVALLQPEEAGWIEARVHAGDDGEPASGRHRQLSFREPGRVTLVGCADLVDDGHAVTSRCCFTN